MVESRQIEPVRLFDARCRLHTVAGEKTSTLVGVDAEAGAPTAVVLSDGPSNPDHLVQQLAERPGIAATAGVTPAQAAALSDKSLHEQLARLEKRLADGGWCGVGPTGLDFEVAQSTSARRRQKRALDVQIAFSDQFGLPVTLVGRGAYNSLLKMMRQVGRLPEGGVVHDFDGSPRQIGPLLMVGVDISFGPALFGADGRRVGEAVVQMPEDRILVETNFAGQGADPGDYEGPGGMVEKIAVLRGEPVDQIAATTVENGRRRFGV